APEVGLEARRRQLDERRLAGVGDHRRSPADDEPSRGIAALDAADLRLASVLSHHEALDRRVGAQDGIAEELLPHPQPYRGGAAGWRSERRRLEPEVVRSRGAGDAR